MISPAATPPIRAPLLTEDTFEETTDAVIAGDDTNGVGVVISDGAAVAVCTIVVVDDVPSLLVPATVEGTGSPAGPPSSQIAVVTPADWVAGSAMPDVALTQPR